MKIVINGEEKNIENDSLTVEELLESSNVEMPDMVSVQLNGAFVDRDAYPSTEVNDGDAVDFLYYMGGGEIS